MTDPTEPPDRPAGPPREAVQRWRLVFRRTALRVERAQREQTAAWEAAVIASGLPLAGLDGPGARPRIAVAAPLAAGMRGEAELLDLWLTERRPAWHVREQLAAVLPDGHELVEVYDVWLGEPPLPGQVVASVYRATLEHHAVDAERLAGAARALADAESIVRQRRKGEAMVSYDLRPFIESVEVTRAGEGRIAVRMTLRHDPEKGVGRPEEVLAELADRLGVSLEPPVLLELARERPLLAADRRRSGTAGRRPG